jgi:hypothetical protein
MATNTMVLIIVTTLAVLVLAGVLAGVVYKTRTPKSGEMVRDQVEENALRLRRQQTLADEFDARAHAAQVEIDIKTVRACSLQQQATAYRSEAVTSRDQLNEMRGSAMRGSADKLTAAAQPPTVPRLTG